MLMFSSWPGPGSLGVSWSIVDASTEVFDDVMDAFPVVRDTALGGCVDPRGLLLTQSISHSSDEK